MVHDLIIVGGGINGVGIARDAAGRGLSVALFEKSDLASGTSSASTKLIHGGLRYLEYYEFRLVREALTEREVLLAAAPHIIWPLRFVLPHHAGLRPAWFLRLGLFIYDYLGGRRLLPPTRTLDLRTDAAGVCLKPGYATAFEYSDCWVEDSRLVVLNAMDAAARGARISTRTEVISARRDGDIWRVTTRNASGREESHTGRVLINAAGPWVSQVSGVVPGRQASAQVRLVQGSHIVVRKLFEHDRCYIFQNADGRIIFAIPYEQDFTLIGTTDSEWSKSPENVRASVEEIAYLCTAASEYFREAVTPGDVVWSYSGVRSLYDDGAKGASEITRDYVLDLDAPAGAPGVLNIYGGKITTFRRLAEHAIEKISPLLPTKVSRPWTARASLPGGDFPPQEFGARVAELGKTYAFVPAPTLRRLFRAYGSRVGDLLANVRSPADLGDCFGADLYEIEVRYLMQREWATCADDVLWRRSKLGLRLTSQEAAALDAWMQSVRSVH